ncbi:MAG TPA: DUF899 family protein [Polyangiales bacterium]|nr:DUF899 family protein [Polyangiales bacterium]
MTEPRILEHGAWLDARERLLIAEKELTRARDALARRRRELPWEKVAKAYRFQTKAGQATLAELFGDKSQLLVYHLMYAPDWEAACKSCSFWMDGWSGVLPHLAQRDVQVIAISQAPLAKLQAYAQRMGWSIPWVSSAGSDFNFDYRVSFSREAIARGEALYNYDGMKAPGTEMPGVSVFKKTPDGTVFHTYSTYARGIDALNPAYQLLDLLPDGRDEDRLEHPMAWVKRHDEY